MLDARIIPVIDLKGGQVVRGVAGRRGEYRAVQSRMVQDARPKTVARAFATQFGFRQGYVADLDASMEFYGKRLELEPIPRPAFSFPGAWYRLGEVQELHLIAGRDAEVNSGTRGNHFALGVESMDAAEAFLSERGISHTPRQTRPDGAFQIYVEDPDGYWIEFCQEARGG